jgi:hypothetical protein
MKKKAGINAIIAPLTNDENRTKNEGIMNRTAQKSDAPLAFSYLPLLMPRTIPK